VKKLIFVVRPSEKFKDEDTGQKSPEAAMEWLLRTVSLTEDEIIELRSQP